MPASTEREGGTSPKYINRQSEELNSQYIRLAKIATQRCGARRGKKVPDLKRLSVENIWECTKRREKVGNRFEV